MIYESESSFALRSDPEKIRIIRGQNNPVIPVVHSYGGAVIAEAGNDPRCRSTRVHRSLRAG